MSITLADLQAYVGKPIDDICDNDFASADQNHCAHFVSHALGLQLGMLCGDMKFATRRTGGSIRCDDLFNRLPRTGPWADKPAMADGLLVFVTSARNVKGKLMSNAPQKHVGIHHTGRVFNFSNSQHKVVVDMSIDAFHTKFKGLYSGGDVSLYFGATS